MIFLLSQVLGDLLVLLGCVFYAISNIGQEHLVKSFDRFEFLGMLGCWGTVISAVQMAILERDALASVEFTDPVVLGYLIGFNICLFLLYYFTPLLLLHSSALFMNLSFLTSDFWSILFAVSLFHARLNLLYFVAFAIIIVGLVIYNLAGVEGSVWEILVELCRAKTATGGEAEDSTAEEHRERAPSDADDTTSLPATHAHTRPAATAMVDHDGFHPIDTQNERAEEQRNRNMLQQGEAEEHHHEYR
jgi:hypothetical protein